MKTTFLLIMILLPRFIDAQIKLVLSVTQPAEFGFSLSRQDTTIEKGKQVLLGSGIAVYGGSGLYSYLWSPATTLNNPAILNPLATPTDTTVYMLKVTDKNGCSFSWNYKVNVKTTNVISDIIPTQKAISAVLYPNPVKGEFKIQLTGKPLKMIELLIIDNLGRILSQRVIRDFTGEQTEFFRIELSQGMYTLQIIAGAEHLRRSFIIY
jgi:hypothetical protein